MRVAIHDACNVAAQLQTSRPEVVVLQARPILDCIVYALGTIRMVPSFIHKFLTVTE